MLTTFRENAKFGISLTEIMSGNLEVVAFNLTSEPCLPNPMETADKALWPIYFLLLGCMLSCAIEAYMTRLRSRICNVFFPERANERTEFLHREIKSGREKRKTELRKLMINFLSFQMLVKFNIICGHNVIISYIF